MAYIYGAMVLILITFLSYKKKALHIITNSPLKAHCRPIFRTTNILTVINQYVYDCLVHVKIDLNNHNSHFQHHNYPTRHNYFIVTPNIRLTKRVCPGESVQFSRNKTKNFDHYMDYYYLNINIEFYVPDKKIGRKC